MLTQSNELDFSGQNFYCGIDTHKKKWAVTIETDDISLKTFSQNADPQALVKHLKRKYPGGNFVVGYESGYFGFNLYRLLKSEGIECKVIHPADIPTTHKEKDQKRDPLDSRKIAKALRSDQVNAIWVPKISQEQDRKLLRTRRTLTKDQTRVKNRIKALLQIYGVEYPDVFKQNHSHWSRRFISWLQEINLKEQSGTESLQVLVRNLVYLRSEILTVSRHIRRLSETERYKNPCEKLREIPGIGLLTAMIILTEIGDITRFRNVNHFRSYIGFIPRANSSGEKDYNGRITSRSSSHLRPLLIDSAWSAVRNDSYYLQVFSNYKKSMKPNKAIVRTARKLINQIYYTLKSIS
ncbi:MAG: IS110 family transposase [Bacteroidales bacterium]|nr:IS110 family transposase [Bacteroidales bacterium]